MKRVDGGQVAARGFHFQYLVTVERLLQMVEDPAGAFHTLHVENSGRRSSSIEEEQSIDLSLEGDGEHGRVYIQIKSVEDPLSASTLGANEAIRELTKLLRSGPAERYELITNRPLSKSGDLLRKALLRAEPLTSAVPKAKELLDALTPAEMSRLAQSRLTFIDETTSAYRQRLRQEIRTLRTTRRLGTGFDSSGLLTGYLVDKVFQSAAGIASSQVTRAEAAKWLATDPPALAAALGEFDWGNTIGGWPALPLLPRPALLEKISSVLLAARPSRKPAVFVLKGPSGIGKSSVAAEYAYGNHDQYEFMAWINGQDADALRASFTVLLESLSENANDGAPATPEAVASALCRRTGRWLLIIDNVIDAAATEPWIPSIGEGDVLLTTLDSTAWTGRSGADVGQLMPEDSVELLSQLLAATQEDEPSLVRLAKKLDNWPLALVMAASYINGAQMPLVQATEEYLQRLIPRVVADGSAVPEGYPRTLAEAINLAIDDLASDGATHVVNQQTLSLTKATLYTASFFSNTDIPVQLLIAATVASPEQMLAAGLEGPTEIIGGDVDANDIIRVLRRRSLLQRRTRASSHETGAYMSDLVSINSITQMIVQSRLQQELNVPGVAAIVGRAAYHVDQWLKYFIDSDSFGLLLAITPHAASVTRHAEETALASVPSATLAGNLALAYRSQGLLNEAAAALNYEIRQLRLLQTAIPELNSDVVLATTLLQLLDVGVELNTPIQDLHPLAKEGLAAVERVLVRGGGSPHPTMGTIANNYGVLLRGLARTERGDEVARLLADVDELIKMTPPTDGALLLLEIESIDNMLSKRGHEAEAADRARSALGLTPALAQRLQLLGLLGEALAYQENFVDASAIARDIDNLAQPTDTFPNEAVDKLNNLGIAAVPYMASQEDAFELLSLVVDLTKPRYELVQPASRRMHHVLQGALAIVQEDRKAAAAALERIYSLQSDSVYGVTADSVASYVVPQLEALVSGSWPANE